jgi:hypothetical protein
VYGVNMKIERLRVHGFKGYILCKTLQPGILHAEPISLGFKTMKNNLKKYPNQSRNLNDLNEPNDHNEPNENNRRKKHLAH